MLSWACEEALHLGKSPEVTREQHAKGDASVRCGERSGCLQQSLIKFSFPPRKPQEIAKRENCHRKQEMCQPFIGYLHRPGASDASVPGAKILQLQLQRQDYQKKTIGLDILIWIVVYKLSRSCNPWIQLRHVASQRSCILFKLWPASKKCSFIAATVFFVSWEDWSSTYPFGYEIILFRRGGTFEHNNRGKI